MKLILFYQGKIPTEDGDYIDDIMKWGYEKLEGCHSYIQWLFPMKEGSMFHPEVPCLTEEEIQLFRTDTSLRTKIQDAFHKILDFYGLEIQGDVIEWQSPGRHKNPRWWLEHFNHNFLRITRILKSLRYMGLEKESQMVFRVLVPLRTIVSENTFSYWEEASKQKI